MSLFASNVLNERALTHSKESLLNSKISHMIWKFTTTFTIQNSQISTNAIEGSTENSERSYNSNCACSAKTLKNLELNLIMMLLSCKIEESCLKIKEKRVSCFYCENTYERDWAEEMRFNSGNEDEEEERLGLGLLKKLLTSWEGERDWVLGLLSFNLVVDYWERERFSFSYFCGGGDKYLQIIRCHL